MARNEVEPTTEVGRQLEKERENRGLTKEQWSAELRTSKPAYIAWLTRPVDIQGINVRRIAKVMGVTTTVVYGWIEVDSPKGVYLSSLELAVA